MAWTAPEAGRTMAPALGDERSVLDGWLDYHRQTLLQKCAGLTDEQLKTASVEPSDLTLLGLVRHMTEIELWFRCTFTGEDLDDPYATELRPDAAFDNAAEANAQADLAMFVTEVALARDAQPKRGLDEIHEEEGEEVTVRWLYLHMLEEYARHNGHADLLRERIDGVTGE